MLVSAAPRRRGCPAVARRCVGTAVTVHPIAGPATVRGVALASLSTCVGSGTTPESCGAGSPPGSRVVTLHVQVHRTFGRDDADRAANPCCAAPTRTRQARRGALHPTDRGTRV